CPAGLPPPQLGDFACGLAELLARVLVGVWYASRLPIAEEPLELRTLASELRLPALTGTAAGGVLARHAEVLAALVGVEALARATRLTLDGGPGAVGTGVELVPQRRCPHDQVRSEEHTSELQSR